MLYIAGLVKYNCPAMTAMTAFPEGSITRCLLALQQGEAYAPDALWERYFRRLVGLARTRLGGAAFGLADEEDIALSAFDNFCRGVELGRFRRLDNREDLWQVLCLITVRKAANLVEHERAQKRNGTAHQSRRQITEAEMEAIVDGKPTPHLAVMVAEQCKTLLDRLPDQAMQKIALLRMEGFTDDEISAHLGCARRTVQRRIRLIKELWEQEVT